MEWYCMFDDLDWPLTASRGFVSISWISEVQSRASLFFVGFFMLHAFLGCLCLDVGTSTSKRLVSETNYNLLMGPLNPTRSENRYEMVNESVNRPEFCHASRLLSRESLTVYLRQTGSERLHNACNWAGQLKLLQFSGATNNTGYERVINFRQWLADVRIDVVAREIAMDFGLLMPRSAEFFE